jgi:hypothetical protein
MRLHIIGRFAFTRKNAPFSLPGDGGAIVYADKRIALGNIIGHDPPQRLVDKPATISLPLAPTPISMTSIPTPGPGATAWRVAPCLNVAAMPFPFHQTLLAFAAHYRYQPRPVAVARGNEKCRQSRSPAYITLA